MSGAIEDIAKKWLAEPAYTKVFKHTADVIEDYICYFLTAIGAIALSVKFLTSLGSGDLSCIIGGKFTEPSQFYTCFLTASLGLIVKTCWHWLVNHCLVN